MALCEKTALETANRWLKEARRHEAAADELHSRDTSLPMSEEAALHLEIARTLRNCSSDLRVLIPLREAA